ncbi:holin [Anaerotruncus sp. 80]|uniref:Holin n=2 Tax=Oscillospiraceae TaxID=216572 RepID=A0A845QND4_9FIRM|nr:MULTISPECIES: phage holin family protein [Anaerotruncus]NBH61558.1 holin [Anaerotruncus colihominis]NCF02213.1 holin [Anaerotruncus sp. 80]
MKQTICTVTGITGSVIAGFFGGWTSGMTTLLICMIVDYITGLIVAGVFGQSPKSKTGALESKAGWKGLCRKCMTMLFVLVAYRLDLALSTAYIRDAVVIGFICNEVISIIENAGIMGLPVPKQISKAIELLKNKEE